MFTILNNLFNYTTIKPVSDRSLFIYYMAVIKTMLFFADALHLPQQFSCSKGIDSGPVQWNRCQRATGIPFWRNKQNPGIFEKVSKWKGMVQSFSSRKLFTTQCKQQTCRSLPGVLIHDIYMLI